jgi:hypothetical protein
VINRGQMKQIPDAALAKKLAAVMDELGALINPELVGAMNYKVNQVACSKGVFPGARANCSLKLAQ